MRAFTTQRNHITHSLYFLKVEWKINLPLNDDISACDYQRHLQIPLSRQQYILYSYNVMQIHEQFFSSRRFAHWMSSMVKTHPHWPLDCTRDKKIPLRKHCDAYKRINADDDKWYKAQYQKLMVHRMHRNRNETSHAQSSIHSLTEKKRILIIFICNSNKWKMTWNFSSNSTHTHTFDLEVMNLEFEHQLGEMEKWKEMHLESNLCRNSNKWWVDCSNWTIFQFFTENCRLPPFH